MEEGPCIWTSFLPSLGGEGGSPILAAAGKEGDWELVGSEPPGDGHAKSPPRHSFHADITRIILGDLTFPFLFL